MNVNTSPGEDKQTISLSPKATEYRSREEGVVIINHISSGLTLQ